MYGRQVLVLVLGLALWWSPRPAQAHCEVPCGIYGDELRIAQMLEDVTTVEKAMRQIQTLGAAARPDHNQLVRWITTKEQHATRLQQTVAQYWLHQRVKPVAGGDRQGRTRYLRLLEVLHRISVRAMKAKQGTDLAHVSALRDLVQQLGDTYFGPGKWHPPGH